MSRDYPWPASRIDRDLMRGLHLVSVAQRPRIPISKLVRKAVADAVERHLNVLQFPSTDNQPQPPPQEAA